MDRRWAVAVAVLVLLEAAGLLLAGCGGGDVTVALPSSDKSPPDVELKVTAPDVSTTVGSDAAQVLLPGQGVVTFTANATDNNGGTKKVSLEGSWTLVCKDVSSEENVSKFLTGPMQAETIAPGANLSAPGDNVFIHLSTFVEEGIVGWKSTCPANSVFTSLQGHIRGIAENYYGASRKLACSPSRRCRAPTRASCEVLGVSAGKPFDPYSPRRVYLHEATFVIWSPSRAQPAVEISGELVSDGGTSLCIVDNVGQFVWHALHYNPTSYQATIKTQSGDLPGEGTAALRWSFYSIKGITEEFAFDCAFTSLHFGGVAGPLPDWLKGKQPASRSGEQPSVLTREDARRAFIEWLHALPKDSPIPFSWRPRPLPPPPPPVRSRRLLSEIMQALRGLIRRRDKS
jgi:hypothetical protein